MVTNVKVNAIYTHMPKGPRAPYTLFCKSVLDQFNFAGSYQKGYYIHLYSPQAITRLHCTFEGMSAIKKIDLSLSHRGNSGGVNFGCVSVGPPRKACLKAQKPKLFF